MLKLIKKLFLIAKQGRKSYMSKLKIKNIMDLGGRELTLNEIKEVIQELSNPYIQAFWDTAQLLWLPHGEILLIYSDVNSGLLINYDDIIEYEYKHQWDFSGAERLALDTAENLVYVTRWENPGPTIIKCKTVQVDHACLFIDLALNHPAFKNKCELIPWKKHKK